MQERISATSLEWQILSRVAHALSVAALVALVAFLPITRGLEFIIAPASSLTVYARLHIGLMETLFILGVLADPAVRPPCLAAVPGWAKGLGLSFLAWSTLTVTTAGDHGIAVIRQTEWLVHAAAALCLWMFLGAYPRWRAYVPRALVMGFLAYGVLITFFLHNVSNTTDFPWLQAMLGFRNIRHFSAYAAMAVLAGLLPLFAGEKPSRQEMLRTAAVVTVAWAFLFWSGGRGAFLAIAAALGALTLLRLIPRPKQAWAVIAVSGLLGLAVSVPFTPSNGSFGFIRMADRLVDAQNAEEFGSGRLQLWAQAAHLIGEHPVLGLGPDNYAVTPRGANDQFEHPHDAILQAALDWGIPGMLMVVAMVLMALVTAVRNVLRHPQAPAVTGLAMLLMLLALSLVSSPLYYGFPTLICGFALVLALPAQARKSVSNV